MIKFFSGVDGIYLDAIFIAIIVLIAFLGVIKGFKKTLISSLIFSVSLFLSFCPLTNSLKKVLVDKVLLIDKWMPAGSDNMSVFVVNLLLPLLSSVFLFVLFYCVIIIVKTLISVITKAKSRDRIKKSKIGRVFGAIISLLVGGITFIALIFMLNNNLVGMKTLVKDSTVTNFVVEKVEGLLNVKDSNLSKKLVVKLYKGNVLAEVSDEMAISFSYIDEKGNKFVNKEYKSNFENDKLNDKQVELLMEEYLRMLYSMSVFSNNFDEKSKDKYCVLAEEMITIMHIKAEKVEFKGLDISVSEYSKMKISFRNSGLDEKLIESIDDIVNGK